MPHLLIVEDDAAVRDLVADIAAEDGYTVARAGDIRQARIQLDRQKPDVMLLDVNLPDGNGIDLWKQADLPGTQLVFMTADADVDNAIEALRCGAVDYLLKPVSLRGLRGVL